jgi:hypothetical protein
LARHIARRSRDEDRALLEDLAMHPEKREPPLSWGLQYIVRGDIVFDIENEITFDALAKEAGLEDLDLPFLEDMPEHFEVPIEK